VQTFLPVEDFEASARALDTPRLGKQRVETLQIVRALTRPGHGFRHHPAARMWRGYEEALGAYGAAICREWVRRGHADTCEVKIMDALAAAGVRVPVRSEQELQAVGKLPPWLGDEALHRSHRSALVRKNPGFYRPQFGDVEPGLPYVWPEGPPAA
jgi:hypothetical protein